MGLIGQCNEESLDSQQNATVVNESHEGKSEVASLSTEGDDHAAHMLASAEAFFAGLVPAFDYDRATERMREAQQAEASFGSFNRSRFLEALRESISIEVTGENLDEHVSQFANNSGEEPTERKSIEIAIDREGSETFSGLKDRVLMKLIEDPNSFAREFNNVNGFQRTDAAELGSLNSVGSSPFSGRQKQSDRCYAFSGFPAATGLYAPGYGEIKSSEAQLRQEYEARRKMLALI